MNSVTTWAEAGQPRFELDPIRLQFRDSRAERIFQSDTLAQSIYFIRAYLIAGTLLYSAFGVLDVVLGGHAEVSLLTIRFAFVIPILVGIFLLTFRPAFQKVMQPALAIAMLSSGMGILAMTAIMGPPFNSQYYAGLIMVVSYCGSMIRLNFRYSAVISVWLFTCYQLVGLWINPIPVPVFISNDFFLGMASGVGLFAAYIQEMYLRQGYVAQKAVEEKNWLVSESLSEAMRANKSKGEFLATMSHELRTPLNAIIGFSDIIRRELFGPIKVGKYTEYARDIHESGGHLLAIINDILDLAKAESGKLELTEREFDVVETIRTCIRMCQMRADESGVRIVFSGGEQEIRIIADERLVLQVFCNLLINGIKFTPEDGSVRVQISAHPT
jgi:two-component system, cell cycle sensor histidine kinase PleC